MSLSIDIDQGTKYFYTIKYQWHDTSLIRQIFDDPADYDLRGTTPTSLTVEMKATVSRSI